MVSNPALADPIARFTALLEMAIAYDREKIPEPTAFTLSTVNADGWPSSRVLLLKGVDGGGFVFYTNLESRKGIELLGNPYGAMCFHWAHLETQVRIEGKAEVVSEADADAYFASRPRGSQIGAWASNQSRSLDDYATLDERVRRYAHEFEGGQVPRPSHWSGFRLTPERIEFWRNMPSRLHHRDLYQRNGSGWDVTHLYP